MHTCVSCDGWGCYYMPLACDNRGKKITCPGARDKLNFRQDKQIFSHNIRRASNKFAVQVYLTIYLGQVILQQDK